MTYPVPDRLVPVRREIQQRKVLLVFAILAAIVFAVVLFNGHIADLNLLALGLLLLSLHFVIPVAVPGRRV